MLKNYVQNSLFAFNLKAWLRPPGRSAGSLAAPMQLKYSVNIIHELLIIKSLKSNFSKLSSSRNSLNWLIRKRGAWNFAIFKKNIQKFESFNFKLLNQNTGIRQ